MDNIKDFEGAIKKAKEIVIFSHVNPDGDTLSTNLALANVLQNIYKKENITCVYAGKLPAIYDFLPDFDKLINIDSLNFEKKYDLVICVDVAAKDRIMNGTDIFDKAEKTINIDHHKTNKGYADFNYIDAKACSAGQVLYDIFEELNIEITKDLAVLFYTSIMTDTGGFKYENTSVKTLNTAAVLLEKGANPCDIYRHCYESKPQEMVQFQAFAISNAIYTHGGKVAHTIITKEMMKKFNATDDFTDGISEALRTIRTVEISMVLKENSQGNTKVSLRSKNVDITKITAVFDGGGHQFAAGCTIKKPAKIAINKLLEEIDKIL
ncbi:MAG: bifunctional oligoribonuclease/PAP phosphatase NrnA [Candidatus Gastranaerophilales bacterium]|nr:bifunctional oligoribonuclease/PAP phosphatase NrnA [Candidatus Gastranaerophilales bacterium]